jgi:hypothetical protein
VSGTPFAVAPGLPSNDLASLVVQHLELGTVLVVQKGIVLGVEIRRDRAWDSCVELVD